MSIIMSDSYADFKTVVGTRHFKDILYFDNSAGGLFVIYALADNGLVFSSGNQHTAPVTFATDFPDALPLSDTLTLS